ncbi:MAG TPA: CBS domain-containing protein [Solirubrobacteraceae bacterium]|nr:CBS domain-containing protein [Solirubrobacteraceae bacterium]
MTSDPRTVSASATLEDAAREMGRDDIGAVLVEDNGSLAGILTDRDIVVRAIAERKDPSSTKVGDVASRDVASLTPDQTVEEAIKIVREQNVRRIPVVQDGRPAGIVSIGDLAIERDTESALADISSEPANN